MTFGTVNTNLNYVARVLDSIYNQLSTLLQNANDLQKEQNDLQKENNELQKENTDAVNNLNKNITDQNVDINNNISSLPSDDTQDITSEGFDNIFNMFYNTFTTKKNTELVVNIPFTDKSFKINSSSVYNGFSGGVVSTLINAFWYFVFGLFIVKDISKKINKIKSGNIEDVQDFNVKEDLL